MYNNNNILVPQRHHIASCNIQQLRPHALSFAQTACTIQKLRKNQCVMFSPFESYILHTLCDLMSSMSLAMKFEDDIILGSLVTQSKASFVAISPIPTKDVVASMQYPELTSATRMYSSNVGTCSSCNHLASAKYART